MLLGNYIDEKLSAEVYSVIDNVIELVIVSCCFKNYNLCISYNLFLYYMI